MCVRVWCACVRVYVCLICVVQFPVSLAVACLVDGVDIAIVSNYFVTIICVHVNHSTDSVFVVNAVAVRIRI